MISTRLFRRPRRPFRAALLAAALLLLAAPQTVRPQAPEETDGFVRSLLRFMEAEGYETAETGRLARALHAYRWEELEGADPELVALALGLVKREREPLRVEDTANLAHELALMARQMQRLGFEPGQITRAAVNGVRAVLAHAERARPGGTGSELTEAIRMCLSEQIRLQERMWLQQRIRLRPNLNGDLPAAGSHGGGRPH